jgi:hypothetical protein
MRCEVTLEAKDPGETTLRREFTVTASRQDGEQTHLG